MVKLSYTAIIWSCIQAVPGRRTYGACFKSHVAAACRCACLFAPTVCRMHAAKLGKKQNLHSRHAFNMFAPCQLLLGSRYTSIANELFTLLSHLDSLVFVGATVTSSRDAVRTRSNTTAWELHHLSDVEMVEQSRTKDTTPYLHDKQLVKPLFAIPIISPRRDPPSGRPWH